MTMSVRPAAFLVLCMSGAVASAMPAKNEIAKAQPVVNELMKPLVEDFKAKEKDAVAVGDSAVEYASEAASEAAKFLLLKGAVNYFAKGKAYDKVVETLEALQGTVKNIPPDTWLEIVSKASDGVKESDAPALVAIHRQAEIQANAHRELLKAYSELNRDPNNAAMRKRFAEMIAVTGDWKRALEEFAKLKGSIARAAKDELSGKFEAVKLGDIWWDYAPEVKFFAPFAKAHAADFYRQAVAAGKLSGLKGPLVEKRIAEAEATIKKVGQDAVSVVVGAPSGTSWTLTAKFKTPLERTLKLAEGVDMPFCACPPSMFTMSGGKGGSHKVTITRPFWISKTFISQKQFAVFRPDEKRVEVVKTMDQVFNGVPVFYRGREFQDIDAFIVWLNEQFGKLIPRGYVFRLPTGAELEYVERVAIGDDYKRNEFNLGWATNNSLKEKGLFENPYKHSGKPPEWWGMLFDPDNGASLLRPLGVLSYLNVGDRLTLDRVNAQQGRLKNNVAFAAEEVDPVLFGANRLVRCGIDEWCVKHGMGDSTFAYVVIGPDLIAEKKAGK